MTPADLADVYLKAAADLRAAVAGLTREQWLARPVPGKWSCLEVVCHLADFEPILADRMKRIIALDKTPLLVGVDENRFAAELRYHDRDPDEELALIEATRRSMARVLRPLTPDHLQRTGCHSERGLVTLEKVIQTANYHIPHHLPFLVEKRKAMGV